MSEITDAEVAERLPDAWIDQDNVAFFRGLLDRRLLINRCADCSRYHSPPRPFCPTCWSDDVRPTEVSGRGTLHSFTVLHVGPPFPDADYAAGYPVGVIDLEEQPGVRATAKIVGVRNEEIRIGMPVELTWIERDGAPVPAFRPAGA
ncbi:MAG: Zn-ribbon domain-containing OB-fold protein [Microbacterium sp.]